MTNGLPLWQQILYSVVAPLIGAVIFRFMARAWAKLLQGEAISEQTRRRQKFEFWMILVFMYVALGSIFIYAHFIGKSN
jgi:uncharacterized membrane protein